VVGESNDTIPTELDIGNKGIKHIIQMKTTSTTTQLRNQPTQNKPQSLLKNKNFYQEDSIISQPSKGRTPYTKDP